MLSSARPQRYDAHGPPIPTLPWQGNGRSATPMAGRQPPDSTAPTCFRVLNSDVKIFTHPRRGGRSRHSLTDSITWNR